MNEIEFDQLVTLLRKALYNPALMSQSEVITLSILQARATNDELDRAVEMAENVPFQPYAPQGQVGMPFPPSGDDTEANPEHYKPVLETSMDGRWAIRQHRLNDAFYFLLEWVPEDNAYIIVRKKACETVACSWLQNDRHRVWKAQG